MRLKDLFHKISNKRQLSEELKPIKYLFKPVHFRGSRKKLLHAVTGAQPSWDSVISKSIQKWMQDFKCLHFLGNQIDTYVEINTAQTTAIIRWEAFKAFIGGQIMSYTSQKARESGGDLENWNPRFKL